MEALVHAQETYADSIARLNRASVRKHFEAYRDVPWDEPEAGMDPSDPRWAQSPDDPLGATDWYQSRPEAQRARIGLGITAYQMKRGVEFENVLSRGLLEFALARPNRSPDFRYAYHELIEEGQHSLMFQEFVNRTGYDLPRLSGFHAFMSERVPALARRAPELFFVYVLAGEVPIDQTQRTSLRRGAALHPLLRRITQIHVTEEARHICFAHQYLARQLPQLSRVRRLRLQLHAPFVTAETARLMLAPPRAFTRQLGIPDHVMGEVYAGARHRRLVLNAVQPLYETYCQLGLVTDATARLWRLLGCGSAQPARNALPSPKLRLPAK